LPIVVALSLADRSFRSAPIRVISGKVLPLLLVLLLPLAKNQKPIANSYPQQKNAPRNFPGAMMRFWFLANG
jgi:hypothetical protein